jgi:predicted signal transduction protein with EAL and GGDEF domain
MAHGLDLNVVAEGVESPEQLAFLVRSGCDQAQGYLFSKPLPADEIGTLLERTPNVNYTAVYDDAALTAEHPRQTRPSPTIIPSMPRHR